ncbi:MAG: PD-(D/E)XK nuclease family protein [Phycisphaerales bacterium]
MKMRTLRLPDGPSLMAALAEHALATTPARNGILDLSETMVLVPASRAMRALERHLVAGARARRLALLAPEIVTPGGLLPRLVVPEGRMLDATGVRLAWRRVVERAPEAVVAELINLAPVEGDVAARERAMQGLADRMAALMLDLRSAGVEIADARRELQVVGEGFEESRWDAVARLDADYRALLRAHGADDPTLRASEAIARGEVAVGARRRMLVLLADPEPIQRALLRALAQRGVQVEVLVHETQGLPAPLDAEGFPEHEAWAQAMLPVPQSAIRLAEAPRDQAAAALDAIAAMPGTPRTDEIAIAVPDPAVAAQMQSLLPLCGVPVVPLPTRTAAQTALGTLLRALAGFLRERSGVTLAVLVRHPLVEAWLAREGAAGAVRAANFERVERGTDRLDEAPDPGARGAGRVLARLDPALAPLQEAVDPDAQVDALHALLRAIVPGRVDAGLAEAVAAFEGALRAWETVPEAWRAGLSAPALLEFLQEALARHVLPTEGDPAAIELLGWLEAGVDDAPHLVITSMNEGVVPGGAAADPWVPDSVRARLGMPCARRRQARDAWILHALLSRKRSLALVVGRTDAQGDPLVPSRLLLACPPQELAERIRWMGDRATPRASAAAWERVEESRGRFAACVAPDGETAIRSISVTQFRDLIACPYLFQLKRDARLRLDREDDLGEELDERRFGTLVHEVLQAWGRAQAQRTARGEPASADPAEIEAQVLAELDAYARGRFGASRRGAVAVQLAIARERLRAFAAVQAQWAAQGWRVKHAELAFDVPDPSRTRDAFTFDAPRIPGTSLWLTGRIDRVDEHPTRGFAALDYKTAASPETPEAAHVRSSGWIDLQLPLYSLLLAQVQIAVAPDALGYFVLPANPSRTAVLLARAWGPDDIAAAVDRASALAALVEARQFARDPGYRPREGDPFAPLYGVGMRGLAPAEVRA